MNREAGRAVDVGDMIDLIESGQGDTPVVITRESHTPIPVVQADGTENSAGGPRTTKSAQGQAGAQQPRPIQQQAHRQPAPQQEQVVQEQVHVPSQEQAPKLEQNDPNHRRNADPQGYIDHLHTKIGQQANKQGDLSKSVELLTELVSKQNAEPVIEDGADALERFGRAVDPEYDDYAEDASHKKVLQIVQNAVTLLAQAQSTDQLRRDEAAFQAAAEYSVEQIAEQAKIAPWINTLSVQDQQEAMKGLGVPAPNSSSTSHNVDQARYAEVNSGSTVEDFNPTRAKSKAEQLNILTASGKSNSPEAEALLDDLLDAMNPQMNRG